MSISLVEEYVQTMNAVSGGESAPMEPAAPAVCPPLRRHRQRDPARRRLFGVGRAIPYGSSNSTPSPSGTRLLRLLRDAQRQVIETTTLRTLNRLTNTVEELQSLCASIEDNLCMLEMRELDRLVRRLSFTLHRSIDEASPAQAAILRDDIENGAPVEAARVDELLLVDENKN